MRASITTFAQPQKLACFLMALVRVSPVVSVDRPWKVSLAVLVETVTKAHSDRSATNVGNFRVRSLMMVRSLIVH